MAQSPADLAKAQWDYLVTILKNEMQAPNGRIQGVKYVGKAYQLWTEQVPAIGVQLKGYAEEQYAATRHKITTTFNIIVAVQSTDASASANLGANTPPNLEDAMAILQGYISDGTGVNGLSPILRDVQYRNLGTTNGQPNAMRSQIQSIDYEWDIGPGESPQIWAYALVTFIAEALVGIT